MTADESENSSEHTSLAPDEITERFTNLEVGDTISVNNRKLMYEVIDTDTYSIIAEDPEGHRVAFSQNLQSGGWSINEDVFHIETDS